jgi:integrase
LVIERKEKPIMRAEDLFEMLKTLYFSQRMTFDHERHRVELACIMQWAGITGNRPAAILALRYENVKVALLLVNGKPRLIIEPKFEETKSYLGDKEA